MEALLVQRTFIEPAYICLMLKVLMKTLQCIYLKGVF